jgi:hypothetical protein
MGNRLRIREEQERRRHVDRIRAAEEWEEWQSDYDNAADSYERAVIEQRWRAKHGGRRKLTQPEEYIADSLIELHNARQRCNRILALINNYLEIEPALKPTYERFLKAGGVTSADWRTLIEEGTQPPPVKRRGALRLVVDNQPRAKIKRRMLRKGKVKRRMLDQSKMTRNRKRA